MILLDILGKTDKEIAYRNRVNKYLSKFGNNIHLYRHSSSREDLGLTDDIVKHYPEHIPYLLSLLTSRDIDCEIIFNNSNALEDIEILQRIIEIYLKLDNYFRLVDFDNLTDENKKLLYCYFELIENRFNNLDEFEKDMKILTSI